MNIGSSAADIGLVVLLLFPALLAPVLLIGVGLLIGRVLRLPGVFAALFALALIGALLVGGSLYLDSAGQVVPALVEQRSESVALRSQGDWRHRFSVQVRYSLNGTAPVAGQPAPDDSATTLRPLPAQFDRLREGELAQLRVLPLFRSLALVRLADSSTGDYIPWLWLGVAAGALLLFWLARLMLRTTVGGLVLIAAVLAGAIGVPSALSYRRWQASEDLDSKPLRATAQVAQVTRITQVDPFPCRASSGSRCGRRNTLYDVAQPYDIVELRFVPEGAAGEVIAIDAVDARSSDATPGSSVEIAYAAGQARAPQILDTTHTHHWRNTLGFVVPISLVVVLFLAVIWWAGTRVSRARRRRSAPTA